MSDHPHTTSSCREPLVRQSTQGSAATVDGSQFTQNTTPAPTASTREPRISETLPGSSLTSREKHRIFMANKYHARAAARELGASKLTKHSLISPIPGAPSEQSEKFTAKEIDKFKSNSHRQMRAVVDRINLGDKSQKTRDMWEALEDRVRHKANSGQESSEESEEQSGDGLEEERSRESNDETHGLVVDEYDPSRGIEWAKEGGDHGDDDDGEVFIGSTFR